ncbi:MAG: hypothetical protein HYX61_03845 [Gammaproteobacteria bacterium]|jgi:hypothetical protein|nr:hypothetical protein [Gammaproteobacteria bacterium]
MLKHGPSLTSHQLETMKAWYIQPYLQIVADAVEDKGAEVLKNLVEIITGPTTSKQRNLVIGEGVAQPDKELKTAIEKVMGKLPEDEISSLYDALYILLHQFRLNKSPDSPYADDHNAAMIAKYQNTEALYDNTYHKKGKVSFKLREKEVEPSSEQIEAAFIIVIKSVLQEILSENKKEETVPVSKVEESKNGKRKSENVNHPVIDLTLDESPSFLPQFKQKQEQEELDRLLALEMANQENEHATKKPKLSPDEILARKLQEEEDLAYARYLNTSANRI